MTIHLAPPPLQWKKLHHRLVEYLGVSIVRGDLKPGDVLPPEADLSGQFGVSRTVVREAVTVLTAKGLLEARAKTGTRVRPREDWHLLDPQMLTWQYEAGPDPQLYRDIVEVRRILEPEAARLAATRAEKEEIARLEFCYQRMELSVGDPAMFIEADRDFHATIFLASHNELLREMTSLIARAVQASVTLTSRSPEEYARVLSRHRAIVDAIRGRDAESAAAASRAQVAAAVANTERALEQAGATGRRPRHTRRAR